MISAVLPADAIPDQPRKQKVRNKVLKLLGVVSQLCAKDDFIFVGAVIPSKPAPDGSALLLDTENRAIGTFSNIGNGNESHIGKLLMVAAQAHAQGELAEKMQLAQEKSKINIVH